MLDFHNHLMPAVDDGAGNLEESRTGLATMLSQGASIIITTPHVPGSLTRRTDELASFLAHLDEAWERLKNLAAAEFPSLRLERGGEIMLDIPSPDLSDARLRLAGSSFALVEFPYMAVPPQSTQAIRELRRAGWHPVVAHPERYSNMSAHAETLDDWRDAGAFIQVNSGSLIGRYGATARELAWDFVSRGCVDYLSSDYHSRGKCSIKDASEAFKDRGGTWQHKRLTEVNPERLLRNEPPLPVGPMEVVKLPIWKRVLRRQ